MGMEIHEIIDTGRVVKEVLLDNYWMNLQFGVLGKCEISNYQDILFVVHKPTKLDGPQQSEILSALAFVKYSKCLKSQINSILIVNQ